VGAGLESFHDEPQSQTGFGLEGKMIDKTQRMIRFPLMLLAVLTLLSATWAGLLRLGWQLPPLRPSLALSHGPLMVAGFFGTLISLERAVALGARWTYIAPLLSGLGGVMQALGVFGALGPVLLTLGSAGLVLIFVVVLRQHLTNYTVIMALGAVALLVGNLLWLMGWQVFKIVFWWGGFLILTIAGERLELSRLVQPSKTAKGLNYIAIGTYIGGLMLMLFQYEMGIRLASIGLIVMAIWLLRFDIARRTVKQSGLTRFIAVCLLSGYVWVIISGVIGLVYAGVTAGPMYDSMLHAIFLGFVFAMVFGHAPIIFPAVLGFDIPYRPSFYIPLVLLHLSLLLRTGGEIAGFEWTRLWGGLINVLAVILYFGMVAPIGKKSIKSSKG